jgi:inner membrane protein
MLPQSHVAYTWLVLSLAQEKLEVAPHADYRLVALAAMGPDLVDKPLAWAYFYRRYRSAVLFAHTLLAHLLLTWITARRFPHYWCYTAAFLGHALLDRLWYFPDTFYWPIRGWRFHVWRKQGSEQEKIGKAYWITFTRRRELWTWELGGLIALFWFVWRHRLYQPRRLLHFILTGRARRGRDGLHNRS